MFCWPAQKGFQLIELLIVITIISLLTALVIPTYSNFIIEANRLHAKHALADLAIRLEHHYFQYDTYENATFLQLGIKPITKEYQLQLTSLKHDYFKITAQIAAQKSKESTCNIFTLNSFGVKGIEGWGTVKDCWEGS